MLADNTERAGIEEQYEIAGNTSNLRVVAEKRGPGDVIAAAGMAQSFDGAPPPYSSLRTGMALLRLHSEWSAAAKPRRMGQGAIEAIIKRMQADDRAAEQTARRNGGEAPRPGPVAIRANREAEAWFQNELRLLAISLKSRPAVWAQLTPWAAIKGHDPEVVAEALFYWLAPTCKACDGLKLRKVAGQPALSARQCSKCSGTGNAPRPKGTGVVLAHLDEAVSAARTSLKKRLHNERT